jgi:hypothetical protein
MGSTDDDFSEDCTLVVELGWEGRQIGGKEGGLRGDLQEGPSGIASSTASDNRHDRM